MSVIEINEKNFQQEVLESDKPVLVDFWASWCGPCRMMAPVVEEIAQDYKDIKVCKVNVDDELQLAKQFKIEVIPTLVVFKDGRKAETIVGVQSKKDILAKI